MKAQLDIPASASTLTAALEGLTAVNVVLLQRSALPRLLESGVRYRREPKRSTQPGYLEQWKTAPQVFAAGWGDCEDLSCWLAAEYRVYRSEPARALVYRSGRKRFHAVVERPGGIIVDISRRLGMGRSRS